MSDPKWTPGPWKVDEAADLPLAVIQDDADGLGICELGERTPEQEANARLMAAAPELYQALRAMFDEFAYAGMEGEQARACELAAAALAKAESIEEKPLNQ